MFPASRAEVNRPELLKSNDFQKLLLETRIRENKCCQDALRLLSESEREFLAPIDRAHSLANRTLLDFILNQKDLKGILKSNRRSFLLDQGDFIVHFMDMAANELMKHNSQVSINRLNTFLGWALQSSSASVILIKAFSGWQVRNAI